jgi:orotate phosphoribosyltransferase
LLEEILKFNPKSVGGLEVGAIPLRSVVVAMAYNKNTDSNGTSGFYVRKSLKQHGLQKKIEGKKPTRSRCDSRRCYDHRQ